jgi:opacity protein-like surface antigen
MKPVYTLLLLSFGAFTCVAQPNLGIELSYTRFETSNAGMLLGSTWVTSNERDLKTGSIGMGVFYKITERHLVRLGFSAHKQGRMVDVRYYDHGDLSRVFLNVESRIYFAQFSPGYVHRLRFGNRIVPAGIGLKNNKRIRAVDINQFTMVDDYNFDLRLSAGVQYRVIDNMIIGLNAVYNHALTESQYDPWEDGTYRPRQFGLEFSVIGEVLKQEHR